MRLPRDSPLSLVIVNELVQRSGGGAPPVISGAGSFGSGGPSVAMRRYLSHNQRHNAKVHAENAIGWRWAAIRLMRQTRRRRAIKNSARASAGDLHPCKASGMPISTPPFPRVRSDDLMASPRRPTRRATWQAQIQPAFLARVAGSHRSARQTSDSVLVPCFTPDPIPEWTPGRESRVPPGLSSP